MFISRLSSVQQFLILTVSTILIIGVITGCNDNKNVNIKNGSIASTQPATQPAKPLLPIATTNTLLPIATTNTPLTIKTTNDILPPIKEIEKTVINTEKPQITVYTEISTKVFFYRGSEEGLKSLHPKMEVEKYNLDNIIK